MLNFPGTFHNFTPLEVNGVSIEKYADLCAMMADTGGDVSKENAIAEMNGVSAADWAAAKAGFTAKMSDPADMGKTAMAFMPLFQAAQAKARGGAEPGSLEDYTVIHAEMALMKDPADPTKQIDFMQVLNNHNYTHAKWIEMESYWTPVVSLDEKLPDAMKARFNPEKATKFRELMQKESDRIQGIVR